MDTTARRRPTYADLEALPDTVIGEILGGELIVSPRPGRPHALTASGLGYFIGGPFGFDADGIKTVPEAISFLTFGCRVKDDTRAHARQF